MPKETHHDIIGWAVEAWLSDPPTESLGALDGINWLFTSGNLEKAVFDRLIERIRDIGNSLLRDITSILGLGFVTTLWEKRR